MKIHSHLIQLVVISGMILSCLSGCSTLDEDNTGYPIQLTASVEIPGWLSESVMTKYSPMHVMAYSRERQCESFSFLFEDKAYLTQDCKIEWLGKFHYWPGEYVKFIAYWPADADVTLDDSGNIINADCTLIAISEPLCHLSDNPTLKFLVNQKEQKIPEQYGDVHPIGFDVTVGDFVDTTVD